MNCPICAICYDRLERQRNKEHITVLTTICLGIVLAVHPSTTLMPRDWSSLHQMKRQANQLLNIGGRIMWPILNNFRWRGVVWSCQKNSFMWIGVLWSREVAPGQIINSSLMERTPPSDLSHKTYCSKIIIAMSSPNWTKPIDFHKIIYGNIDRVDSEMNSICITLV